MYQLRMMHRHLLMPLLAAGVVGVLARPAAAQVTSVRSGSEKFDRDSARGSEVLLDADAIANAARTSQLQFEQFRRTNLPE